MAIHGPWYISVAAVQGYLRATGKQPSTDGPDFERAELALIDIAREVVASGKEGKEMDSGVQQFRGPRPLRLRLRVSYERRGEGDLPQLIEVLPDHEGRTGAYSRSAPGRKHGRGRH